MIWSLWQYKTICSAHKSFPTAKGLLNHSTIYLWKAFLITERVNRYSEVSLYGVAQFAKCCRRNTSSALERSRCHMNSQCTFVLWALSSLDIMGLIGTQEMLVRTFRLVGEPTHQHHTLVQNKASFPMRNLENAASNFFYSKSERPRWFSGLDKVPRLSVLLLEGIYLGRQDILMVSKVKKG